MPLKVNISDDHCLSSATSIIIPIIPQEKKKGACINSSTLQGTFMVPEENEGSSRGN